MSKPPSEDPLLPRPTETILTEFSESIADPVPNLRLFRWKLRIYALLQVGCIIFVFACINYRDWVRYCWFQFGVQSADNIRITESTFRQNIDYLRYLLCEADEIFKETSETYCPGFCDNLENLVHAGGVMLFFMLYCVMLGCIAVVLHVIKVVNPAYKADFMKALVLSPAVALLVGCVIYLSITDFSRYLKTNGNDLCESDKPVDFELSGGALMWLFLFLLQTVTSIYGFKVTSKEFR